MLDTADDENASKLMQKSAMMGSATGVLCAARSANLTPSVEHAMPFASFKEAFEEILGQAERGDAFCCYMVGNVYYWGDYLEDAAKLGSEEAKEYIGYINSSDFEALERKKEEPATPVAPFWQNVAEKIRDAVAADLREILGRIDDEHIYTAALVTDRYCCSLFLAVNTLEYLQSEDEEPDDESKWHPDEWGYSDGHDSELVKLSKSLWENHATVPGEAFFFSAMISAMAQVKDSGIFGEDTEEITFFISISDDEDAENLEDSSAMTLNSPELAAAFLNRNK